jgi:anti-anti-sigma factor
VNVCQDKGVCMTTSAIGALPVEVRAMHTGQEVAITGRIDVHTVADVRLVLHEIIDTGCGDVHVRLGGAEIGDATGLGVLVEAYNRARRAGRRLAVVDMTERTSRLLRASRLDRSLVLRHQPEPATVAAVTA